MPASGPTVSGSGTALNMTIPVASPPLGRLLRGLVCATAAAVRRRRASTKVMPVHGTLLALAVALLTAGVLAPTVGAASGPVDSAQVHVDAVTVPPVTVPSVSTPQVDVPSVSIPPASIPAVQVPSVGTPAVSTPAVESRTVTPPPPLKTPALPLPARALPDAPVTSRRPTGPGTLVRRHTSLPAAPTAGNPPNARASSTGAASDRRTHRGTATSRSRRRATRPVALRRPGVPLTVRASEASRHETGPRPTVPAVDVARPSHRSLLPGTVGEIVHALPQWVLGAFVGFGLIAMLMAINAYLTARRARALGVQRAALLDDVGLLQTALLAPVSADAAHGQVSVAYRPAAGPAAGGDFYDVITLGPSHTGLLLGDVSGHGPQALRHAALVHYTVRTFLAAGHDPADALARSDECLDADLDGHFATVIAAIYDHDTHTLRYAKAGHHPPVILGTPHDPDAEPVAPPLGAGLGIRPKISELTLNPGSTVCLFTDGLIEARRDGTLLGRDVLVELLDHGRPDGPDLLDRIVEHADEVADDLAVCLLRRP